jgi:hypothetical protein
VEKPFKLDRRSPSGSMLSSASSLTRDLTVPDTGLKEWISAGMFRSKKNHRQAATDRPSEVCRKCPTLIIRRKDLAHRKYGVKKQDFTPETWLGDCDV